MTDKKYWTTLDQLNETAEYLKLKDEEFYVKPAADMEEGGKPALDRRSFIKATGAASVFLAAAGCSDPEKKLVPYVAQPEELIPGNPIYYASIDESGENGLLVKTHEGRPIKLEGNPRHPVNAGKLDARGNASIIDLYDPDRIRHPAIVASKKLEKTTWEAATKTTAEALKAAGAKAVWVTRPIHGTAQKALAAEFLKAYPGLQHIEIDTSGSELVANAQEACYGHYVQPLMRYDRAELIVTLGFDLLSESPNSLETSRLFGDAKRLKVNKMSRVVAFESYLSMTGANSDERFRILPSDLTDIAAALAGKILALSKASVYQGAVNTLAAVKAGEVETRCHIPAGTLEGLANELWHKKGASLVVAGGTGARAEHGPALLNLVNFINTLLENDGSTIQYGEGALANALGTRNGLQSLVDLVKQDRVGAILFQDVDPVYLAGKSAHLDTLLAKVKFKAGLLSHFHATAQACQVILPTLHTLESWNDAEPRKGLHALGQPTINPLWDNRARQDSLIALIKAAGGTIAADTWMDYIKLVWKRDVYKSGLLAAGFDDFWTTALRHGVYDSNAQGRAQKAAPRAYKLVALSLPARQDITGPQLILHKTLMHGDGDSMNNPWLLEAPDPVSKISWENHISVSVATAKKENYKEGDLITIKTEAGSITAPVHIQPGVSNNVYALSLGWGRPELGHVAKGPDDDKDKAPGVGVDASALAPLSATGHLCTGIAIKGIKATGKSTVLACVQGHQYLSNDLMRATGEKSRKIVQDTTLEEFVSGDPHHWKFHEHVPTNISMWREQIPYDTRKWSMVFDTNTCTGCNACTVACQAENNIPCVGKDEIINNREMHWIRIDRYYTPRDSKNEDSDEVDVINQPMTCQHCDNAPCEIVCPVVATTHDAEGVNIQTYNRCVGTRYCSNNCPYKVRHYNWYDYAEHRAGVYGSGNPLKRFLRSLNEAIPDKLQYPLMMQFNPDVTVRVRGVMEKCSFCFHKIKRWNNEEKALGRALPETDKQTACQQACPSSSISFGNILDKSSTVYKDSNKKGAYKVLAELNAQPSVSYLTKLRNRKPAHGAHHDAPAHGASTGHGEAAGHGESHPTPHKS